jgi:hypothetical protein
MGLDSLFGGVRGLSITIVAVVLGVIALVFVLKALAAWRQAGASQSWPSTTGTVLSASIARSPRRGTTGGGSFYPVVTYEYTVNGQRLMGNRISFGAQMGSGIRSWAESRAANYPVGNPVPVYYNPANPTDAVLERSASGGWGNLLIVGVLVVAIVILLTRFR